MKLYGRSNCLPAGMAWGKRDRLEKIIAMELSFFYIERSQIHLTVHLTLLSGRCKGSKVKIGENRENSKGDVAQFG